MKFAISSDVVDPQRILQTYVQAQSQITNAFSRFLCGRVVIISVQNIFLEKTKQCEQFTDAMFNSRLHFSSAPLNHSTAIKSD